MAVALTKRAIDAAKLKPERYVLWDSGLKGFGVQIAPSGRRTFLVHTRAGRRQVKVTVGVYGPMTLDQAREAAKPILASAQRGIDPQRERQAARRAVTVAELCEQYMAAAEAGTLATRFARPKAASTIAIDRGRVSRHIVPLIGSIPARDLTRGDVQRMVDAIAVGKTAATVKTKARGLARVSGGAGTAGRVAELLAAIIAWGQRRELIPDGMNAARGVERVRGQPKDRVLTVLELYALGDALRRAAGPAADAVRLIALTGLRRNEACGLRWAEIDELNQTLRLENTKTGRSLRPIGKTVLDFLQSIPRRTDFVFPRSDGRDFLTMKKPIAAIFDAAGLERVRSHDLRRTFASLAADLGYGETTIGELLGHARRGITEKHYIRRSDPILIAAADRVSSHISSVLDGRSKSANVFKIA